MFTYCIVLVPRHLNCRHFTKQLSFFCTGVRPNIIKGTKAVCAVSDKRKEDDKIWYARLVGKDENSMNVEVSGFYELVHKIKALIEF